MSEVVQASRGNRKERVGVVVSDVQDKTIVVKVERRTAHPLYRKIVKVNVSRDRNASLRRFFSCFVCIIPQGLPSVLL